LLIQTLKGGITEKVTGTGIWTVNQFQAPGGGKHTLATGGRIPGYGGGDKWPALLEGGEAVVPKHLTPAVAPFLKAHGVPGFAAGGVAGNYGPGAVPGMGRWFTSMNNQTLIALETAVARATLAGIKAASSVGGFPGGPGGGAPSANARLAQLMMPSWATGSAWAAWNYVAMRESGWNQFARNPSSGAYGIPQALPPSKMGAAANPPQSNPAAQIAWMISYIQGRYGSPQAAAAWEMSHNWYDQGGWLPPGTSIATNNTGRPERVGGGDVHITVNMNGVITNPRETGRQIADALNRAATGGVRLRPSIIGTAG